jgi:hypothetical protein
MGFAVLNPSYKLIGAHVGQLLLQRNRKPAEVDVRHQPELLAAQFKDCAVLVGKHDAVHTGAASEQSCYRPARITYD